MADEVRLATRIGSDVDRRLRMLALVRRQRLSHLLTAILDQSLPPADELAGQLRDSEQVSA